MSPTVRDAVRADTRSVAEVWVHAFPGERSLAERMHVLETGGEFDGIETVSVAEDRGRIAGALKLYPLVQHLAGAPVRMAGLAAVGVAPWARRRGIARVLCQHAIRKARARSDVVSVLYPFRPDFYERLGWGLVGELHTYRFRPEWLHATGGEAVDLADGADIEDAQACYARVAATSNGLIERPDALWRRILAPDPIHMYVHRAGRTIDGYMLVRYGRAPAPDERPLWIRELVAGNDGAYDALLGWVSIQRDLWRIVRYDALPDENFAHQLRDPRPPSYRGTRWLWAPVARVIRGPMLRILDVPAALEARRADGSASPVRFGLEVHDPEVPDNAGPFIVDFDGTAMRVTRASSKRPVLRCAISTLSQIHAGEMTPSLSVRLGLAECDGDARSLDPAFMPASAFRLLDEF